MCVITSYSIHYTKLYENFSGKLFKVVSYGVRPDTETIDFDQVRDLALAHRPKMIIVGASAYPRIIRNNFV